MKNRKQNIAVLIVDDEKIVRQLLERSLNGEGYDVRSANDGVEAWEMVQAEQPDIIVSDIKMPHLDGFDLLTKVKSGYPQIGFIVMTAYGDSFSVKETMLQGADEYITKPFSPVEVSLIVERTWHSVQGRLESSVVDQEEGD